MALVFAWARYWPLPDLYEAPTSTVLLDKDGRLLCASVASDGQWRFAPTDPLPTKFVTCLVQFEDRNFRHHRGIYLPALFRAARQNLTSGRVVSGGSTLTMQLARLSYRDPDRSVGQKVKEMVLAVRIELQHPKDDILRMYAAQAPFGGNVVGVEAAAWRWFGKPLHELGWAESATLAVLPNAPAQVYPGKGHEALRRKRNGLLDRLMDIGVLDSLSCRLAKEEPLPGKALPLPMLAPHLMGTLAANGSRGKTTRTTLDAHVQERATEAIAQFSSALEANEVHNAAMIVLEVRTGNVVAYVGNSPTAGNAHAGAVDIIRSRRSTGSLLKPFLYADMLQHGELLPDMLVADVPTHYAGFAPRNTDGQFRGAVKASKALSRSLNVPAVRALKKHGVARTLRTLQGMGLGSLDKGADHYGLSLVVGGGEASLWELAGAYASMARVLDAYGRNVDPETTGRVHPPIVLHADMTDRPSNGCGPSPLTAGSIHFTLEALRQTDRPELQSGWRNFSGAQPIAWKTGTSSGHRDAWAIGVTSKWCVAVWTGNASGEGRPGNTGTLAAAPLMFGMFGMLPPGPALDPPFDDMARVPVCNRSGHRASIDCDAVDTLWIPSQGMRSPVCPYHRSVMVDGSGLHLSNGGEGAQRRSWFVLPPAMEHYAAALDPTYLPMPSWPDGAGPGVGEAPFAMIYPEPGTHLLIPLELDGSAGNAVFEATHRTLNGRLFWHLDGTYLGTTTGDHRMALHPGPGEHRITLADASGAALNIPFSVVTGVRPSQE